MCDVVREIKKAFGNTRARTLSCINQRMVDDRDRAYARPSVELRMVAILWWDGEIVYKGEKFPRRKHLIPEAR